MHRILRRLFPKKEDGVSALEAALTLFAVVFGGILISILLDYFGIKLPSLNELTGEPNGIFSGFLEIINKLLMGIGSI